MKSYCIWFSCTVIWLNSIRHFTIPLTVKIRFIIWQQSLNHLEILAHDLILKALYHLSVLYFRWGLLRLLFSFFITMLRRLHLLLRLLLLGHCCSGSSTSVTRSKKQTVTNWISLQNWGALEYINRIQIKLFPQMFTHDRYDTITQPVSRLLPNTHTFTSPSFNLIVSLIRKCRLINSEKFTLKLGSNMLFLW